MCFGFDNKRDGMFSTVFFIYRNVLLLAVVLKVFITNVNI